jgi:hypothetical protein
MVAPACEQLVQLAVQTGDTYYLNQICLNAGDESLADTAIPACARAVELTRQTEDLALNSQLCQNATIEGLAEVVKPACERAVELVDQTDNAYLASLLCQYQDVANLTELVQPACEQIADLASELQFGKVVTGVVEVGNGEAWTFEGSEQQIISILMKKDQSDLDTYVTLFGPDRTQLIDNDDSVDGSNSRIDQYILPTTGAYTIIAHGFSDSSGAYTLELIKEDE